MDKEKSYRLKKDIVIPKGTVFSDVNGTTSTYVRSMYRCTFGLTNHTSGNIIYGIDLGDKEILNYFEEIPNML